MIVVFCFLRMLNITLLDSSNKFGRYFSPRQTILPPPPANERRQASSCYGKNKYNLVTPFLRISLHILWFANFNITILINNSVKIIPYVSFWGPPNASNMCHIFLSFHIVGCCIVHCVGGHHYPWDLPHHQRYVGGKLPTTPPPNLSHFLSGNILFKFNIFNLW